MSTVLEAPRPPVQWPEKHPSIPQWKPEPRKLRPIWSETLSRSLLRRLLDPAWFWMLLGTYEGERIIFDPWQVADLHDSARIRFREKAPQIGFSWLRACEAVHEAIMYLDATTGFVSVNEREASEKVLYALKLYDGLPELMKQWVPLAKASSDELHFGDPVRPSRVMSIPATSALRGRRMSVVLDEADFYKDGGRDMFRVAVGRISRGGRISLGSTCFGQDTQLDRGMQGLAEDGDAQMQMLMHKISRARFPWTVVENQEQLASIDLARATLTDDDFAEEYECVRGGLGGLPFPAELLRRQTHGEQVAAIIDGDKVPEILWEATGELAAGYDVGKTRNPSILSIFEKRLGLPWQQVLLFEVRDTKGNHLPLPTQHEFLATAMRAFPRLHIAVDAVGVGAHIAQALEREFGTRRVVQMVANAQPTDRRSMRKREMVTETKRQLEDAEIELLPDKEQALQFRRTVRLPNGEYDQPGSTKDTHYDRFWSTVYASYIISEYGRMDSIYNHRGLTVVGGRRR